MLTDFGYDLDHGFLGYLQCQREPARSVVSHDQSEFGVESEYR